MSTFVKNHNINCSRDNDKQNCWMGIFLYPPEVIAKTLKRPASPFIKHKDFTMCFRDKINKKYL